MFNMERQSNIQFAHLCQRTIYCSDGFNIGVFIKTKEFDESAENYIKSVEIIKDRTFT